MKTTFFLLLFVAIASLPAAWSQSCSGLNFQLLKEIPADCGHMTLSSLHDQLDRPYLYVAQKEGGLTVFDIADPENPEQIPGIDISEMGGLHVMNLYQSGNLLFLALGNHFAAASQSPGLAVIDVSFPAAPLLLDTWVSPQPEGGAGVVRVAGDFAYLGAMEHGLIILDASDPGQIQFVSAFVPDIYFPDPNPDAAKFNARGMEVRDDIVYLCYDAGGLRIINVADKENPVETGRYANPALNGLPRAYNNIALDGDLAYLAVDYCGMEVLDISDTSDITLNGWWNPWNCQTNPLNWFSSPGHANEISLDPDCGLAYLSTGKSDLHVVDVSDPAQPDSCNFFGGVSNNQATWGVSRFKEQLYLTYICAIVPFFSNWTGVKIISFNAPCTSATESVASGPGLVIWPNPASGQLQVSYEGDMQQLEVFDLLGRIRPVNYGRGKTGNLKVDISYLSPGWYLLRMQGDGRLLTASFVVK